MSVEENKTKQRRVFEEVLNKGNLEIIPEFIAPNYVVHNPLGLEAKGPEGFKQVVTMLRTAFPDMQATIDVIFAEGDMVTTRFTMTGTFKGEMMGIPPTGNKFTLAGILITHWEGGKEVEAWEAYDTLAWYRQLGISPPSQ
jgi:predicted ester cyclase